jgi:hypothetical protein
VLLVFKNTALRIHQDISFHDPRLNECGICLQM